VADRGAAAPRQAPSIFDVAPRTAQDLLRRRVPAREIQADARGWMLWSRFDRTETTALANSRPRILETHSELWLLADGAMWAMYREKLDEFIPGQGSRVVDLGTTSQTSVEDMTSLRSWYSFERSRRARRERNGSVTVDWFGFHDPINKGAAAFVRAQLRATQNWPAS